MDRQGLKDRIRLVPDFPKPGILFRDIAPMLRDPAALEACGRLLAEPHVGARIDAVLGIESRGFLLGVLVARQLGVGFVPVRKAGRLPGDVLRQAYSLEYGVAEMEVQADALQPGERVLIVDDLIATGGTALAACRLAESCGAEVAGLAFLVELAELGGRRELGRRPVHVVIEA